MASESIYAPKNLNKPVVDNAFLSEESQKLPDRSQHLLNRPVLYIADVNASLTDRDLANGVFNPFVPVRLKIDRGSSPHNGKVVKGTVEFQTIEKAEQAYATISNPRLSFTEDVEMSKEAMAKPRLIKQLPPEIEDVEIFDIFRPYGPIASARRILMNPQGRHTGFRGMAIVVFYNEADAQRAQDDLHCAEVEGNTISVTIDTHSNRPPQFKAGFRASATPFVPGVPSSSSSHHMNAAAPAFQPLKQDPSSSSSALFNHSNAANIDPCNLFCKNLDYSIDSAYLDTIFRPFGSIVSARVMRDERGVSKGFGFVSFTAAEEAARALQALDKSMQGGKQMTVRFHEPKRIRNERLAQEYGSTYTASSGVEPPETPSEGIADSEGFGSSMDGVSPQINDFFSTANLHNGDLAELERLQIMSSIDRRTEVSNRLKEEMKRIPEVEESSMDQLVSQLCKLTLPQAVRLLNHPEHLSDAIKEIQSRERFTSNPMLQGNAEDTISVPSALTERQRLEEAVLPLLSLEAPMEGIVDLLMELPSKERAMSLFNQDYLRRKVEEAEKILGMADSEDTRPQNGSEPAQLTRENIEIATALPNASNGSESIRDESKASHTMAELAALPALEIIKLANSTTTSSLPIAKAKVAITKETDAFVDSIRDLSLTDQKQKLGDQLFKKVKSFGVKGAPKITIALLDSEDLRSLAHLMDSYPDCLREKVMLRVGK